MVRSLALALLALAIATQTAPAGQDPGAARRQLVLDGSAVHDLANVQLNITNWGLIGSRPGSGAPYSTAPSLRYPAESGVNHLFAAGLWIGGSLDDGVPRVSTGQFQAEFLADPDDPLDTIYRSTKGRPQGRRYPAPNADDDHDGLEDEDPLDGRDNDGDGFVDEDYAEIGDQYFRAAMRDDILFIRDLFPDHNPLGIEVVQHSFQFADEELSDVVGFRYEITNVGDQVIREPRVGMFADFDVGNAANDLAEVFRGVAPASDGSGVDLVFALMRNATPGDGKFAGVVLLDPDQSTGGVQIYAGNQAFERGGDPTNDVERYQALSADSIDPSSTTPNDYRVLITSGRIGDLAPGESFAVDVAFVVGETRRELTIHAADAAKFARGEWFDRDGDPATGVDGKEFHVPWYAGKGNRNGRGAAAAGARLRLSAGPRPANPAVLVEFALPVSGPARLDVFDLRGRHVARLLDQAMPAGEGRLIWDGRDDRHRAVASGTYLLRMTQGHHSETVRAVIVR